MDTTLCTQLAGLAERLAVIGTLMFAVILVGVLSLVGMAAAIIFRRGAHK